MLQPKRTKFRKQMKGRNRGLAQRGSTVSFGKFMALSWKVIQLKEQLVFHKFNFSWGILKRVALKKRHLI